MEYLRYVYFSFLSFSLISNYASSEVLEEIIVTMIISLKIGVYQ